MKTDSDSFVTMRKWTEISFKGKSEEKSQDTIIISWDKAAALGHVVEHTPELPR